MVLLVFVWGQGDCVLTHCALYAQEGVFICGSSSYIHGLPGIGPEENSER